MSTGTPVTQLRGGEAMAAQQLGAPQLRDEFVHHGQRERALIGAGASSPCCILRFLTMESGDAALELAYQVCVRTNIVCHAVLMAFQVCDALVRTVQGSVGPVASDVAIVTPLNTVLVTKTCHTILRNLQVSHPIGRLLVDTALRQGSAHGDGSASVLLAAHASMAELRGCCRTRADLARMSRAAGYVLARCWAPVSCTREEARGWQLTRSERSAWRRAWWHALVQWTPVVRVRCHACSVCGIEHPTRAAVVQTCEPYGATLRRCCTPA